MEEDAETGLYYLRSRYYDPEWGRFLNADISIGRMSNVIGHNVYIYCYNNPIMYVDEEGLEPSNVEFYPQWSYRIERTHGKPDGEGGFQDHIHLMHKKTSKGYYAQNEDGSKHDKDKNGPGGGPPNEVKEALKEKIVWDWDAKHNKYYNKTAENGRQFNLQRGVSEANCLISFIEYDDDNIETINHGDVNKLWPGTTIPRNQGVFIPIPGRGISELLQILVEILAPAALPANAKRKPSKNGSNTLYAMIAGLFKS